MSSEIYTAEYPKDNLYRRLGTRSDISQKRIREKYAAKLKEFPPETHPEEFQKIREAYVILSDPQTRAEYDAQRHKGGWEKLMDAGTRAYADYKYDQAQNYFEQALRIRETHDLCMMLAHCHLFGAEDEAGFEQYCNKALDLAANDDERCTVINFKAVHRFNFERFDEGLALCYQALEEYPGEKKNHYLVLPHLRGAAYELERFADAFQFLQHLTPEKGSETEEDLVLFKFLVEAIGAGNFWDRKSFLVARLKSLAKNIEDEQDLELAKSMFEDEFDEYDELGMFREAELTLIFLLALDKHDPDYKKWHVSIKNKVAVEKNYKKLLGDESIFPGAKTFVSYWFFQRFLPRQTIPEQLNSHADFERQMEDFGLSETDYKFELGSGLQRIRKRHPEIYKVFEEEWSALLAECTQGLSRRDRRALR